MKSKADKMFKELGYKKVKYLDGFEVYTIKKEEVQIIFHRDFKELSCTHYFGIQELQAINEKCKELGWIDE